MIDILSGFGTSFQIIAISLAILLFLRGIWPKREISNRTRMWMDAIIIPLLALFFIHIFSILTN